MKFIAIILYDKDKRAFVEFTANSFQHDSLMYIAHKEATKQNYPSHIIEAIYKILYGDE